MSDSVTKWHELMEAKNIDITYKKFDDVKYDNPDGFYKYLNELQMQLMEAIIYIDKIKKQK